MSAGGTRARRLGVARALVDGSIVPGDVVVRDGRVAELGVVPAGADGTAVPGLVDLQVNGFAGVDLRRANPDEWSTAAWELARHGAVAVQPTFHSCTPDEYRSALASLAEHTSASASSPPAGCTFLPAHLEGPFLSPSWVGAHESSTFADPDPALLDDLLAAGPVGMVTLAPELPGALGLVTQLVRSGIVVSVGHCDADVDQARAAFDAGARHLTHCWNAHRRFAPRDPGPAGAALTDSRVTVGLVADLVHVAPETVALTAAAARGRLAATTDAVTAAGTSGTAGPPRTSDGVLAGGAATPAQVLANLVGVGLSLAQASDACGGAQRRLLGLPEVRLRPGDPADVAVVDEAFEVTRTLVAGVEVWSR